MRTSRRTRVTQQLCRTPFDRLRTGFETLFKLLRDAAHKLAREDTQQGRKQQGC